MLLLFCSPFLQANVICLLYALYPAVRKLRAEKEDAERFADEVRRDFDREVQQVKKYKRENEFLKKNLEEVESQLTNRTWEAALFDVEENLRGCFTKEDEGTSRPSDEENDAEWMVNVDALQIMADDLMAIVQSYKPYLNEDSSSPSEPPRTESPARRLSRAPAPTNSRDDEQAIIKLKEAEEKVKELESQKKLLEMQLSISEQRRIDETNTLKETIRTVSDAMGKVQPKSGAGTSSDEVDTLRSKLRTAEDRLRTVERDMDAGKNVIFRKLPLDYWKLYVYAINLPSGSDKVRTLRSELESARENASTFKDKLDSLVSEKKRFETEIARLEGEVDKARSRMEFLQKENASSAAQVNAEEVSPISL